MKFDIFAFIYESFYTLRIISGIAIFSSVYCKIKRRLPIAAVIAIAAGSVIIGTGFYPILVLISNSGVGTTIMRVVNVLWYTLWPVALFGLFMLCYRTRLSEYAIVFALSCLAECFIFGILRLFIDMGVFELRVNTVFSLSLEFAVSAMYYTILGMFISRLSKHDAPGDFMHRTRMVVYYLSTVALNMFLRLTLQHVYEEMYGTPSAWIINVVMAMIPLFLFALDVSIVLEQSQRAERDMLGIMMTEREKQYAFNSENMDAINRQAHDLKRRIRALEFATDAERGDSIAEMKEALSLYDTAFYTDNASLNALLSEKSLYCATHGIRLSVLPDAGAVSFMSPIDIYNMFGNMIDNAIEAVEKLDDPQKRVISFTMRAEKGVVCVQTENFFAGEAVVDGVLPKTSKSDGGVHGYGLKSIRLTAEKYSGRFDIDSDGDVFIAQVTVPIK